MTSTVWDELTMTAPELLPFFRAGAEGRLVIARCFQCHRFQWPPRPCCRYCQSDQFDWPEVEKQGRLFSWTTSFVRPLGASTSTERAPHTIVIVELDLPDLVRMVGGFTRGSLGDDLEAGIQLIGNFDVGDETTLPALRWARSQLPSASCSDIRRTDVREGVHQ